MARLRAALEEVAADEPGGLEVAVEAGAVRVDEEVEDRVGAQPLEVLVVEPPRVGQRAARARHVGHDEVELVLDLLEVLLRELLHGRPRVTARTR